MDWLTQFVATQGFMPHGYCFQWTSSLLWTYVFADGVIALAYYSIPIALWSFVRRREDLPFSWVFVMFAAFIMACGTTHVMGIVNIWRPVYWIDAGFKALTATVSLATAALLWPLLPRALALPSPATLRAVNRELEQEISARRGLERELQSLNHQLEQRVAERTAELAAANAELRRRDDERERSSGLLLEAQQLLASVVDNAAAVIYVKGIDGRYLLVNRRYQELFHVTQPAMLDKTDYDVFEAGHADAFRRVDEHVARTGETVHVEEVAPLDDGEHTYVSVKFPVRDAQGQIYAIGGISTDITERTRAELALRESEERTRTIVDTALDAVITMDAQGLITAWNAQAETTFGWTAAQALGQPLGQTIVPQQHRQAHVNGLQRYLATRQSTVLGRRMELSARHRDGHEFPVELAISPLGGGDRLSFSAFVRDITERKRAEGRLRAQLERLNLLDQITCAIGERQDLRSIHQVVVQRLEDRLPADFCCICDHDPKSGTLTVQYVGRGTASRLAALGDLREGTVIEVDGNGLGRCVAGQLVHEPDLQGVSFPFPRRLTSAGLRAMVLVPLQSPAGVAGVLVAARREANSFLSGDCEFLRQLSAHVALAVQQAQLYGSLQKAYEDLRQSEQAVLQQERLRALGEMASGIAHDINNAISPVTLYAESLLARETNLSPRGREQVEGIARAIDDVAATVARMREFYRPREPQLAFTTVALNRLVSQVIDHTQARWRDMPQQRGIVIETSTDLAEDLPAVMGIESELREALVNLVFNAVDAMPNGGRLSVRTHAVPAPMTAAGVARVRVEVSDTGVGMDEHTLRHCLEPFFTTKGERGTGLGLAMVYGVMQRHGAELDVASEPGRGTTVSLGFAHADPDAPRAAEASSAPPELRRLRILLVDDDPVVLIALSEALRVDGHEVETADGGQAGIDALSEARADGRAFDALITDLGMPYVDGRTVARAAKQDSPARPVLLLTGWGQRLIDDGEVPAFVDAVLSKPPKLAAVREALARLCGSATDHPAAGATGSEP